LTYAASTYDGVILVSRNLMGFVVLISIFCLIGTGMIVGAFRRSVPCEPVCANCGYDLRGYTVITHCSECGRDLRLHGAVRIHTRRVSRGRVLGGLLVIFLPWLCIGSAVLFEYAGPRLRTNRSYIADINSAGVYEPALWDELARRVKNGRLSGAEATLAVDQFIVHIHQMPTPYGLVWETPFYVAADRAGMISSKQYLEIARACFPSPQIGLPSRLWVDNPAQCKINPDTGGFGLPGTHTFLSVQEISMSGASATTEDILQRPGQGTMLPPNINLLGQNPFILLPAAVPEGRYTVKFVIQTSVMRGASQAIVTTAPAAGPTPLAQWTETITMPVQVYRNPYGKSNIPQFRIRTDAAADPKQSGSLSIVSAEALCYTDATTLIFHMKVSPLPVWWCFDQKLNIAGQEYSARTRTRLFAPDRNEFEDVFSFEMPPLSPDITTVDLNLIANPESVRKLMPVQVWGKTVSFKNIPFKRRECNFSLSEWRTEKNKRDLKATTQTAAATTLPSPSTLLGR
jgi:hypothetical protein